MSKLNDTNDVYGILDANINQINIFLKMMIKKNIKINNFIYSSSASVYSINENINFFTNKIIYGLSKLIVEKLLFFQSKKIKFNLIIARIFNIYGYKDQSSLISKIIKNKKIKINKMNDSFRDFIHIDDVSKIYEKLLSNKKKFTIVDIGLGKAISVNSLIKKYAPYKNMIYMNQKKKKEILYSKADTTALNKIMKGFKYKKIDEFLIKNIKN